LVVLGELGGIIRLILVVEVLVELVVAYS